MKRTYDLQELLWQKMFDYGFDSHKELAAAAGIDHTTLWHIMNEKGISPRAEIRRALCRTLDIDPDVLHQAVVNGWTVGG